MTDADFVAAIIAAPAPGGPAAAKPLPPEARSPAIERVRRGWRLLRRG